MAWGGFLLAVDPGGGVSQWFQSGFRRGRVGGAEGAGAGDLEAVALPEVPKEQHPELVGVEPQEHVAGRPPPPRGGCTDPSPGGSGDPTGRGGQLGNCGGLRAPAHHLDRYAMMEIHTE